MNRSRLVRLGMAVALGISLSPPSQAAPCESGRDGRPSVGLVLSGGGARGAAHIGVMRALENHRVPVDCIAGTSMGAIVGGLYASGLSVDEIEHTLLSIDWKTVFRDEQPRQDRSFHKKLEDEDFLVKASPGFRDGEFLFPKGVVQGQSLGLLLETLTDRAATIRNFDDLRVPFRAVATDIGTGEAVALAAGNLADALEASMSIPGVLPPVEIDGKLLVDGGVSNNLPVNVARDMGADVLVVVSIGTPLSSAYDLHSAVAITQQLTTIMTQQNTRVQLASLTAGDVLIEADLGTIGTTDFLDAPNAIPIGEKAVEDHTVQLSALALSEPAYRALEGSQSAPDESADPVIEFVELTNNSRLGDDVLLSRIGLQPGHRLNRQQLDRDLAVIYGLGSFERVNYEVVDRDGRTGVVIDAVEKSWGPNFVQFGLAVENDLEASVGFNVAGSYTRTGLNALGGEWRTEVQLGDRPRISTRWWQPLDAESRYFIEPRFDAERFRLGLFGDRDTPLSVYRVSQGAVSLQGGRELGTWGELRLGLERGKGDTDVLSGIEVVPTEKFDIGNAFARFSTDTLDNRYFPTAGHKSALTYTLSREGLGASEDYETLTFGGTYAFNWGRHRLVPGVSVGTTLSGDLPLQDRFTLGGFLNLSGFSLNQLSGRHRGLGRAVYYYRLNEAGGPLDVPIYLGGSVELGNTWDQGNDVTFSSLLWAGSIFLGMDTFLGPLYLGGGLAEGGQSAYYFFLGKTF